MHRTTEDDEGPALSLGSRREGAGELARSSCFDNLKSHFQRSRCDLRLSHPALPPAWKEIEAAARSFGLQPQLLDVRSPRLWPRHSRAQSGSVPTHSSSGSTPSRRRTRGSLLTLPLGIDCRRSMLPWSLPGRAPDAVRASDQPQDRQGPWPDDPAVAPAAGGSGEHPPFPGRSAPTRPGEIGSWRRAFPLNS